MSELENMVTQPTPEETAAATPAGDAATAEPIAEPAAPVAEAAEPAAAVEAPAAPVETPAAPVATAAAEPAAPQPEAAPAQEPVVEVDIANVGAQPAADTTGQEPPKGSGTSKIVLIVLLIVALVAGAIALVSSGIFSGRPSDPKKALEQAYEATSKVQSAYTAQVLKEIPALAEGTTLANTQEHLSVSLQGLSGFEGASVFSAMLKNTGFSIDVASDIDKDIYEADLKVLLSGNDFFDASLYISPELWTGSVPALASKTFALNPASFVEDYKTSAFYSPYDDASLETVQEFFDTYSDTLEIASAPLSQEKMADDMLALLRPHLDSATYETGEEVDGLQQYIVTMQPEACRTYLIDLLRYIYLDSELSGIYKETMSPMLAMSYYEATTYEDFIDELLAEMKSEIPDMNCVLVYNVDKKDVIRTVHAELTPVENSSETALSYSEMTAIIFDYVIEDNGSTMDIRVEGLDYGDPIVPLTMKLTDSYENGEYKIKFDMDVDDGYSTVTFPMTMTWTKDGKIKLDLQIKTGSTYYSMAAGAIVDGTFTSDKNGTSYDLSGTQLFLSDGSEKYMVDLDILYSKAPLSGSIETPADPVYILEMNQYELDALLAEIEDGAKELGRVFERFIMGMA